MSTRYVIKEQFWSWGDDFYIFNENQEKVFFVDGQAFSWGDKLSFQDLAGNELAFISQRMLSWMPTYEIRRDGALFAQVKKEFSWFKKRFTLDVPGPNDYAIEGSFWLHDYHFTRSGRNVATVSKAIWAWSDSYGIEIAEGEDDVAILCAAIVIDQVLHDES
ncbi:MAG: LURP-one-related family protein, partial [Planctomycetota bacterium]